VHVGCGLEAKRSDESACSEDAFASLKRFAGSVPRIERCELCGAAVAALHPHLVDQNTRAIVCACGACALLFSNQQEGRFLRIPSEVRAVPDFASDGTEASLEWEALALPIDLAFFVRDTSGRMRGMYPSPAGAIESSLPVEGANRVPDSSAAAGMRPEVQALLVSRIAGDEAAFLVPIDECYRLTGMIRAKWRGLSGGTEVRIAIRDFLAEMRTRAGISAGETHA
jgi:Family of unknown function (DUF5947)